MNFGTLFSGVGAGASVGAAGGVLGAAAGAVVGAVSSLFGGSRSTAQIQADQANSIASNSAAFTRVYGISLTDQQVQYILQPGWNAGENGTQLWARMVAAYSQIQATQAQTAASAIKNAGNTAAAAASGSSNGNPAKTNNTIYYILGAVVIFAILILTHTIKL